MRGPSAKHDPMILGSDGYSAVGSFCQAGSYGIGSSKIHQCWVLQDQSTLGHAASKSHKKAILQFVFLFSYLFSHGKEEILLLYYFIIVIVIFIINKFKGKYYYYQRKIIKLKNRKTSARQV